MYIHSFPTTSRTQELSVELPPFLGDAAAGRAVGCATRSGDAGVLVLISEVWGAALAGGDASHVGELAQANVIK